MDIDERGSRWGPNGGRPLFLLSMVALIDAIERGLVPGVLTRIQDDFHFTDTEGGILATAFVLSGVVLTLPSGYLADRRPRTKIIALCLAMWGVLSAVNAAVFTYWQLLGVRSLMGAGDAFNGPAGQSLTADYYPAALRGRAYAIRGITPIAGTALGTGLGGLVGATLGWRWAFLLVGAPGGLLALSMWRLREPGRGDIDGPLEAPSAEIAVARSTDLREDLRRVWSVKSLHALILGTAISSGATAGLGFWAPAFYERHTNLSESQAAGLTGGLILTGALAGAIAGGLVVDRLRDRFVGAAMLVAGVAQAVGGLLLASTFPDVPLWYRLPAQAIAVAMIVGGFPALSAMLSEVVPAAVRGIAFSLSTILAATVSALSPLLIGAIADQFEFNAHGVIKGNLARAFLIVTPLITVGGLVVLRGRRHVPSDLARAGAA